MILLRNCVVAVVLALTATQLEAQELTVVIFTDGTELEVSQIEVQDQVLVLRTREGRRQLVPRAIVDEAATELENPGLFTAMISAEVETQAEAATATATEAVPQPADSEHAAMPADGHAISADIPALESSLPAHEPMAENVENSGHHTSRLSDEPIALAVEEIPSRPKPLLELGSRFLDTGPIGRGIRVPGGAVWQPSFLLFGSFQSVLSTVDDDVARTTRWANRLNLFGNIYLSQTERILFGLRPLDETNAQGGRSFTGSTSISPDPNNLSGSNDHFNFDSDTISHLFFEGDFGELLPGLDDNDRRSMDFGFSFGRQPINFQEGLLINDSIDAIGITRNNQKSAGSVNYRITTLFAWNEINRNTGTTSSLIRNAEADSAQLIGIFNEIDWRASTVSLDAIYVAGGTFEVTDENDNTLAVEARDGYYYGVSLVQRFGGVNTAFRLLGSVAVSDPAPMLMTSEIGDPADEGQLFFAETSWTTHGNHNFSYVNAFYARGTYRAAALDPNLQGPLARAGILFAGSSVGDAGAISSEASDAWGAAFGRQWFYSGTRRQLIAEAGLRFSTQECTAATTVCIPDTVAVGVRYQMALGRRVVFVVDGYVASDSKLSIAGIVATQSRSRIGGRVELVTKF